MKKLTDNKPSHLPASTTISLISGLVIILGLAGYVWYQYSLFTDQNTQLQGSITDLKNQLATIKTDLITAQEQNQVLAGNLQIAQDQNNTYEKQLKKNEKKIDTLEKLTETDPELLKKYSKVYFLNENYTPPKLSTIDQKYFLIKDKPQEVLKDVLPYLEEMLDDAADDGVDIRVASSYRSFGTQAALKTDYKVLYGAGTANQFSADQGYSEHQLGTAVDLSTPAIAGALTIGFDQTNAYKWLLENAHRYGFILSYPKGNAYYQYEPWHWRFVGEDLARDLHRDNKMFYELDQREIDDYLVKLFD